MSRFALIRGWFECPFDECEKIKTTVRNFTEQAEKYGLTRSNVELYITGWHFPKSPLNWVSLVFFGANINEIALPFIRDMFILVSALSGDISGEFYIEDEEGSSMVWKFHNGNLNEDKI